MQMAISTASWFGHKKGKK